MTKLHQLAEASNFPCVKCQAHEMQLAGFALVQFEGKPYLARSRTCPCCGAVEITVQAYKQRKVDVTKLPDANTKRGYSIQKIRQAIRSRH